MEQSNTFLKFVIRFFVLLFSTSCLGITSYAAGNTFIFNPNTLSWKAVNANGQVVRTGRAFQLALSFY